MDVHTTNYTLCDLSRRINPISGDVEDRMGCPITIAPDYKLVVKFVDKLRSMNPADDVSFICGYEAGCLGSYFSLVKQLADSAVNNRLDQRESVIRQIIPAVLGELKVKQFS